MRMQNFPIRLTYKQSLNMGLKGQPVEVHCQLTTILGEKLIYFNTGQA